MGEGMMSCTGPACSRSQNREGSSDMAEYRLTENRRLDPSSDMGVGGLFSDKKEELKFLSLLSVR
jgi:hypothetical protein